MPDMEEIYNKQDQLQETISATNGVRVVNVQIVELLWWCCLYKYGTDDKTYKKIAMGKRYKFNQFGEIALILYQLKFWYDLKCRENKHKHHFHKSAKELGAEFPWMFEKRIARYLTLLADLEIIYREPGQFRHNVKKYSYSLNTTHPLVLAMYFYEALAIYVREERKNPVGDDYWGTNFLMNLDEEQVAERITNNSLDRSGLTRYTEAVQQLDQSGTTVQPKWSNPTDTLKILFLYYTDPSKLPIGSLRTPESNTEYSLGGSGFKVRFSADRATASVQQADNVLENAVREKLSKMEAGELEKIRNLKVGTWRKNDRNGYYKDHKKRDDAKAWFEELDSDSKELVEAFQEEMYSGGRISKEYSYNCSLVDAHEHALNFLQFVLNRMEAPN